MNVHTHPLNTVSHRKVQPSVQPTTEDEVVVVADVLDVVPVLVVVPQHGCRVSTPIGTHIVVLHWVLASPQKSGGGHTQPTEHE